MSDRDEGPPEEPRHIRDLKAYVALARRVPERYEVYQTYDGEQTKLSDAIMAVLKQIGAVPEES